MALLPILHYPDPRLHKVASPVAVVNDRIRKLIIDISETRDQLQPFINPEIVELSGETETEEGCLSVPGIFDRVRRAERVTVRALNTEGEPFTLQADGLLAVCIQHEIDHLDGKVFVEYLSRLKQQRIAAKLKKQQRAAM